MLRLSRNPLGLITRNAAAAIYGTIVTAALIAGDSAANVAIAETVAPVAVALPRYWLAHAYAEYLARGIHDETPPRALHTLRQEWPTVGSAIPLAGIMVVLRVASTSETTAVYAALWLAVVELFVFALAAARHNGLRGLVLLGTASISALFGIAIVALKAVLH